VSETNHFCEEFELGHLGFHRHDGTNDTPDSTPNFDEAHDDLLFVRNGRSGISVLTRERRSEEKNWPSRFENAFP